MNSFLIFFQKELMELVRTKKLYILLGVFVFFGMTSPVIARYMSEILELAVGDMVSIELPSTSWVSGWSQFYSNLTQTGGICIIFIFMSCVSGEKQSGSIELALTKNLSHTSFIMAKFAAAAIAFLLSILLAGVICYAYTYYLFGYAGKIGSVIMGLVAYSVFVLVLLSVTMLSSTMAKNTAFVAMLSFCGFIILIISSYLPGIGHVLPGILLSKAIELTSDALPSGMIWTFASAVLIAALCLFLSICILEKQEY